MISGNSTSPGPKAHFLLGHIPELSRDLLGFLEMCSRDYGSFVPFRVGLHPAVLINDPVGIEEVLIARHREFVKGKAVHRLELLLGKGLVTNDGDYWKRQRRMVQPAFHRERIFSFGDKMTRFTDRLLSRWQAGQLLDIQDEMMKLTFQVVTNTLFDLDVESDAEEFGRVFNQAFNHLQYEITGPLFMLPTGVPTIGRIRTRKAVNKLNEIVYGIIEQRRAGKEEHNDLLDLMMQARDQEGFGMTDKELRDETMSILVAGGETIALSLSWTWYLLSRHPEAAAKLAAEADSVLGGRKPTAADIPQLRYTESVLMESMRLYPPVSLMSREAVQDCEIGGYPVRAGTLIAVSQWVMHRDSRFFDQPDVFDPDRWTGELSKRLPKGAYFPFSLGPRGCIGQGFAMMESVLILAMIAQKFRFTLLPGHTVTPKPVLALRPKHGVKAVIQRRSTV
jgi:cytochrome P450